MRFHSKKLTVLFLAAALPILSSCGDSGTIVLTGALVKANRLGAQAKKLVRARKYQKALPMAEQALAYRQKSLKPDHPFVIESMDTLADIYVATGRYEKAEKLFKRRLAILEKTSDPEHLDVAATLYKMAPAFSRQGKFAKASSVLKRARAIYEKNLGPDHAFIADTIKRQANLYESIGAWRDAVPLLKEARLMRARLAKKRAKLKRVARKP